MSNAPLILSLIANTIITSAATVALTFPREQLQISREARKQGLSIKEYLSTQAPAPLNVDPEAVQPLIKAAVDQSHSLLASELNSSLQNIALTALVGQYAIAAIAQAGSAYLAMRFFYLVR